MVMGKDGEAKKIKSWERKHKVPIFTSGTNHVAALKALKVKRFIGASYFTGEINKTFADYFKNAGRMAGRGINKDGVGPGINNALRSFIAIGTNPDCRADWSCWLATVNAAAATSPSRGMMAGDN